MEKNQLFLVPAFLVLSTLCFADSNCYIASTTHSKYKFNKKEKIILALPQSPTTVEKEFVGTIKQYLIDHKFTLVDSLQNAERILTFRIEENADMNLESSAQTAWFEDLKTGQPSVQYGTLTTNTEDSGYTILEITLQDIELIKSRERSTIWQSFISTKTENFTNYPGVVLDNVMKMYGKNKVKNGKIKKPKK